MRTVVGCGLLLSMFECAASVVPQDLLTARSAYDRALHGLTATVDPADLYVAKETLDAAEKSFADHGDTGETRDLAYTADRQVQIAESHTRTVQAARDLNASQAASARATSALVEKSATNR